MALSELGRGWVPLLERVIAAAQPISPPPEAFFERASRYLDLLVAWNLRMDLTAAQSAEELVDLCFADAAALFARGVTSEPGRWLDVGSGAGAPGLPLALLEPRLAMTLLEPMQKRVAFLRTAVGTLGGGPNVVRGRVEEQLGESVDVAISRATLPPPEWLNQGARVATRQVWLLLAREEPPSHPLWQPCMDLSFEWPLTRKARRAVAFRPLPSQVRSFAPASG